MFGCAVEAVTADQRRSAKAINCGLIYGMSAFGLSAQLGITRKEAQTFIDRYFKHYPGVQQFMEDIVKQARKDHFVKTLLNRIRHLPDINSSNRTRREFAERTAINTPIQGTAADIIKLAMIRIDRELSARGLGSLLLGEFKFFHQAMQGAGFFHRVEVFTLNIFDQGHGNGGSIGNVANDYRNFLEPGQLRGSPASFSGDDFIFFIFSKIF